MFFRHAATDVTLAGLMSQLPLLITLPLHVSCRAAAIRHTPMMRAGARRAKEIVT